MDQRREENENSSCVDDQTAENYLEEEVEVDHDDDELEHWSCDSKIFSRDETIQHTSAVVDIEDNTEVHIEEDGTDSSTSSSDKMPEPTLPICLKFEDVKYKVVGDGIGRRKREKYIVNGISGVVRPGEVLALMGPSGGGKTTLLNLLSGRLKYHEGTITYNNQPYAKSLKPRIGFVLQDDVAFPHLTVKETLTYAALLRLPNTLSTQQKKDRAFDVISQLGLQRCENTLMGSTFVRGISGGERKRVCIGNEIILNPSILLLDEPTSGLDSTAALRIIRMLRNIAASGKSVVTTIHQPSTKLFMEFEKLILLGRGSTLYSGKASQAMLYFSSIGCSPLVAMNPAEFLIDVANGNFNDKSLPFDLEGKFMHDHNLQSNYDHLDVHEFLVESYVASRDGAWENQLDHADQPLHLLESAVSMQRRLNSSYKKVGAATWCEQFCILFTRGLKERRHDYFSPVRVTQVICTAFIMGLLWWHSDASSPKGLEDQMGLLFFISVFWGFLPLFTAVFTFPQERVMLAKERSVGMYRLSAYFVARNTCDLPLDLLLPVIFLLIVYLMVGLKPSFEAFSLTLLTVFLSIVAAQGLGLTIGAAFMDVKKATTVASIILMGFMLSGGFFIQKVPGFMLWIRYISFNYHTYRLLLRIQYGSSPGHGIKLGWVGAEVGAMLAMVIGYRLLAYLFLRRLKSSAH